MNHDLIAGTRSIARGALHRLPARPGQRIECLAGCLWLTQDGDPRDIVGEAGEAFDFDRRGWPSPTRSTMRAT